MGIKERIVAEENEKDSKEMALTRKLFPKGAVIKNLGNENYHIEANFEDDLFLSGGQKIELDLEKKDGIENGVRFEVKKFTVNGQKLNNEETKINIIGKNFLEENKSDPLDIKEYRTEIYFGNHINIIFFESFKTSAALAAYFHELGHINKNSDDISESELNEICDKLHTFKENFTPELTELSRKYIYDERRASLRALESAKLYKSIFDDKKISELKMFYSTMLTRKIQYPNVFTFSETLTITDLDQDWHY